MATKTFQKGRKPEDSKAEGEIRFPTGVPAEIKEIMTRQGTKGDVTQILCKILDGRDKNKTLRRNVRGPVRLGDILVLLETEMEAQRMGGNKKGNRRK